MNPIDPARTKSESPIPAERDARTNAFLASEACAPFVLDCFVRGVRRAVAEEAELIEKTRRSA